MKLPSIAETGIWQRRRRGLAGLTALLLLSLLAASRPATAVPATNSPALTGNWCVAGGFNGWNNASDPLADNGLGGDQIAGDGVFSLTYTVASAARHEFKIVECGNWGNAYPANNSWLFTSAPNQAVTFTFDTNNHGGDAGAPAVPAQNIVGLRGDSPPAGYTAVGDWQGWDNGNPATAMTAVGQGIYHLKYSVATAGAHQAKVVATGSWSEQFVADGRAVDGNPIDFTTGVANEEVVFILNSRTNRVTVASNGSGAGNWCLAGGFNGWNNTSHPLNDDGASGDLLGADGLFSLDFTVANAGRDEFKIVECGNWGNAYPADNAWVVTGAPNQTVKFTFDTNDHSGDAGVALRPATNIVNAWDSPPAAWTVVGPWQGWDNNNPATAMTAVGPDQYRLDHTFAAPGSYEAKISQTGNWDNQIGADGRNRNAPTAFFDVFAANDVVTFYLDLALGRWAILAPPSGGAGHDNTIFVDDLGHDSRDGIYRTPGGPVTTGTAVTLRLRAASNDLTAARVRVWNDRINVSTMHNMSRVADDGVYEWWEATVPASADPTIYWYRFIAIDGTATAYYEDDNARDGGWGQAYTTSPDNSWQLTVYDPGFQTPDWVKNGIIYQIFPDRFRDGDPSNNPPAGRFFYGELNGTIVRSNTTEWNTVVCDPRDPAGCPGTYSLNFYGGDLQGIIDKLDYLQQLGVTIIYTNPIFDSPSNHKYDTTDFGDIATDFGDLTTFQTLVTEAHNRGMKVVLDGVFNHSSSDSVYFDRYSRFDADGNLTSPGGPGVNDGSGACESPSSPWRDWYYFTDVPAGSGPCAGSDGTPGGATYESWFGFDSLPKLNSFNPEVRDFVWNGGADSIARYWMQWADGWRLDVGGDVDPGVTNDPTNDYWEGFRAAVHQTNPDAYIVLEEWGNASAWLLGHEMDATMNYQYSSAILSFWRDTTFVDNDHNSGSSAGVLAPLTPSQLDNRLHNWRERYPAPAYYAMMNLLGSHDTNRPLFMLDHNTGLNDPSIYQNPAYDWSDAMTRLKGVWLLQMTLPGAPTTYYGDEVGLVGPVYYDGSTWQDDPYNRQPFPWLDESGTPFYTHLQSLAGQDALRDYYKLLTAARNAHPALRTGSLDTLLVDDGANLYAYGRLLPDYSDAAVVIVNRAATEAQTVTVDVAGYLPFGAQFANVLDNNALVTVDGSGLLTLDVPAMSGAVLVATGPLAAPPAAVTDLAVTAERDGELDLAWSAAAGADSYDLYRSLVSGGGYALVANVAGTSFTDSGRQNAVRYHYVVVSRDSSTGLASGWSNEASGIPQHDLTTAWYNLQWPPEITHTISTITRTEDIYGQLWIDGATGGSGPASGITAEVGYGPTGTAPTGPGWDWEVMSYNTAVGNNDEYAGSLLPDMLGEYDYVTRWSANGGLTWFYADLSGPGQNGNPGRLHVIPGSDLDAPAAPANLEVTGTTPSSISLAWDANGEPDLAGYELHRQNVSAPGFVRIAQLGPVTSYVDEAVVTNETYDYYVVAYDTSFNRSPASNIVQATAEARLVAVTFEVTVPAFTPGTVYIVGNLPEVGNWNPGAVPMTQSAPHTWTITLNLLDGTAMEYKFTRGNWEKVEKEADGNGEIPNRTLTIDYGDDGAQLVQLTVANWRDPIVVSGTPTGDGVPVNSVVTTVWSQAMNPNGTFAVASSSGPVTGSFAYDAASFSIIFTPDAPLQTASYYTVTVSGLVDAGGDVQQVPHQWSFHTFTPTDVSLTGLGGSSAPLPGWWSLALTAVGLTGLLLWWQRRRHRA